ncbi:DUF1329 domain-containing protein [Marinobacter sp. GN3S48]|uniref:DUF1329 domain-containing protein n=1 Tax=Marinobacter sp. GN3S48 TaxID=3382302 RepID=UPI00387A952E
MKHRRLSIFILGILIHGSSAVAAVSSDEAEKLKSELTPLGAERAGNADGTIPAWDGGVTEVKAGWTATDERYDLFPNESPLYEITAQNYEQYKEKLSDGTVALLKKYPESFRLSVYPTHRTMAAAEYVYENTFRNATTARVSDDGMGVEGAYGGIPFPIPSNGLEAMWNHTLRVHPPAVQYSIESYVGSSNGEYALTVGTNQDVSYPYYNREGSASDWEKAIMISRMEQVSPPFKAGESLIINDYAQSEPNRESWQYLMGQRRVRKSPNVGYDTPNFVASGAMYFDEVLGFFGALDRYDWKLVGKKELYIPYNNNRFFTFDDDEVYDNHHIKSDKVRWELHRVWVVEASVKQSERHAVPKRTFYLDEDSWMVAMVDGYDAEGRLWRTSHNMSFMAPDVPMIVTQPYMVFDLDAETFVASQMFNGNFVYRPVKPKSDFFYSPNALAGDGLR